MTMTSRSNRSVIISEVSYKKSNINLLHLITVYVHVDEGLMWLFFGGWDGGGGGGRGRKKKQRKNAF